MQKGNDTARTVHITLNCINIGLFAWQVGSFLTFLDLINLIMIDDQESLQGRSGIAAIILAVVLNAPYST